MICCVNISGSAGGGAPVIVIALWGLLLTARAMVAERRGPGARARARRARYSAPVDVS